MKKSILTAFLGAMAMASWANHPDSVYIKPDVNNGVRDFQIAYSVDGKHWKHVNCNLFESDYGAWGSEKKLHYPVLKYDGSKFYATFIPNLKTPQIAKTTSDNLALWKPQDYPYVDSDKFEALKQQQKQASEQNIIRIPYSALESLLQKQMRAERNAQWDRDNFIAKGNGIAKSKDDIKATLIIDWDNHKSISTNLMGIFFEDISYAADGGLYAELIQNRDFEYSPSDHKGWNPNTAWRLEGNGTEWTIATSDPIHQNNPHYSVLSTSAPGARLINDGWDGIVLKKGEKYDLSLFTRGQGSVKVSLVDEKGNILATTTFKATAKWQRSKTTVTPKASATKASLVIEPMQKGSIDLDFVSLFPRSTFRGRQNGLRKDLAEALADLKPRFVRFPGGCATHGQGIDNIYHWQATIGELWERQPDMNIWNYHQTRGLGFYEYFQFCEDIGAEPLPVLAAGVPCQNSHRGGAGQQGGIPFEKDLNGKPSPYIYNGKPLTMESYLQELLDLIEWANGDPKTSNLARLRAKAGHPKPFNMKYLGIGNEDLISDVFLERYHFLINGVKKAHPEITVIGTVGPFWEGSDYEYGWKEAKKHNIEMVDEHYYNSPGWYFHHRDFYDDYDRNGTKVYLGEWASKGNHVTNALVEAAYLTNVERNADVVTMTSYAPLLAKEGHTNWNPDLIYFNNTSVKPTVNYYVQRAFGHNSGSCYVYSNLEVNGGNDVKERIDHSVVVDEATGDLIIKVVSLLPKASTVSIPLGERTNGYSNVAERTLMAQSADPGKHKEWEKCETTPFTISADLSLEIPAYSFTVLRLKKAKNKK